MTFADLQRLAEVFVVRIPARDIRPIIWGYPCFTAEGKFIINQIAIRRWSEDGKKIWFGLDTHNTFSAKPDDLVSVVALMILDAAVGDGARARIVQNATEEQKRFDNEYREIVSLAERVLGEQPQDRNRMWRGMAKVKDNGM